MDDGAQVNMDGQPIMSQDIQEKRLSYLLTDLANGQAALQEDPWSIAFDATKPDPERLFRFLGVCLNLGLGLWVRLATRHLLIRH